MCLTLGQCNFTNGIECIIKSHHHHNCQDEKETETEIETEKKKREKSRACVRNANTRTLNLSERFAMGIVYLSVYLGSMRYWVFTLEQIESM